METSYLGNGGRTMATKHPSSRRYPPEVKQRAVQLVLSAIEEQGERHGVVSRIARQLDVGPEPPPKRPPYCVLLPSGWSRSDVDRAKAPRFAELHGGRAWVEPRAGGGSSFRVMLRDPRGSKR